MYVFKHDLNTTKTSQPYVSNHGCCQIRPMLVPTCVETRPSHPRCATGSTHDTTCAQRVLASQLALWSSSSRACERRSQSPNRGRHPHCRARGGVPWVREPTRARPGLRAAVCPGFAPRRTLAREAHPCATQDALNDDDDDEVGWLWERSQASRPGRHPWLIRIISQQEHLCNDGRGRASGRLNGVWWASSLRTHALRWVVSHPTAIV